MHTEAQSGDAVWAREASKWDTERWRSAMAILADRWPVLTLEELEATRGRPEMVASMLEAKIGYAQWLARDVLGQRKQQRGFSLYSPSLLRGAGAVSALSAGLVSAGVLSAALLILAQSL
jgi:hypothetical protein